MSAIELTDTPFAFRNGVTGHRNEAGTYCLACPRCGWQREAARKYPANQDARAHLCPWPAAKS